MSNVTHVHNCKHCDSTCSCTLENCIFPHDVSKWHDCAERVINIRRFQRLVADFESCKFGCRSLPCIHNKWPSHKKDSKPRSPLPERHRPQIINYQGRLITLANENLHTIATRPSYVAQKEDVTTTSYVSDGNNLDYAMSVQRKWIAAKVERMADSFPEHLRKLVKEMRGLTK